MFASATVVVRKKNEDGNYTDFRQCGDYKPLNQETTLVRREQVWCAKLIRIKHFHTFNTLWGKGCNGDRLNARKWIWKMGWMNNASHMSFIKRVNNQSTRYMYKKR